MKKNSKIIKCRGVIVDGDKILLAKHSHNNRDFYAFMGGHMEEGEDPVQCLERELFEELGVTPEIGRLMYINQYKEEEREYLEFFFQVKNFEDYIDINKLGGEDKNELNEILWVGKDQMLKVLPERIFSDFKSGGLSFSSEVVFIS